MIVGIGCDIVEHESSKVLDWETDSSTQNRVLSEKELDIYLAKKDLKFLTGRFAAKEAVLKCLGTGMQDDIALSDIQILTAKHGKPVIKLKGAIKKISDNLKIKLWHISITHSDKCSMAFAIAESF